MIIIRKNTLPSLDEPHPFSESSFKDVYRNRKKWQHMPQLVANQIAEKQRGCYPQVDLSLQRKPRAPHLMPLTKSVFNISKSVGENGEGILLNTATEAVVILNPLEFDVFNGLGSSISDTSEFIDMLEQLGILVEEDTDEYFFFDQLRSRFSSGEEDCINVTIYPTQDCNARCFYCFEQDEHKITMSEMTADAVIDYLFGAILPSDEVIFRWFGGEPLYAANIIDRIITGLADRFYGKLNYHSVVITNASLIDDAMLEKFLTTWHVRKVQTTIDGYHEEHERRKAYIDGRSNTYEHTIKTIGKLLDAGIFTICRFNLDKLNIDDFHRALADLQPYLSNENFFVHATTLRSNGPWKEEYRERYFTPSEYPTFYSKVLRDLFDYGFYKDPINILPIRARNVCLACSSSSYVINSEGKLFRCLEHSLSDEEETGDVFNGRKINSAYRKWFDMTNHLPSKCTTCAFLPCCQGGCKHYRMHGKPDASPCLREKFYIETLLDVVYEQTVNAGQRAHLQLKGGNL